MSDLHGIPWLHKDPGQIQKIVWTLQGTRSAAGFVTGEQTPAAGSEESQHASICRHEGIRITPK